MNQEPWVGGMVVSVDPIVTFSKRGSGCMTGIAGARPQFFRDRKALHLLGLSFTIERGDDCAAVARDLRAISEHLPNNRFVVMTNSEFEGYLLAKHGIASMITNQLIFLNDRVFRPMDVAPRYDAIYNGRLAPFKRHELARGIAKLGLLYDTGPKDEPPLFDEVHTLLPGAVFINHERGQGVHYHLSNEECARELNQARVGLCLSAVEGSMRAAIEYLLCGLPVVSTRSIGGRDRYFLAPFCRIVDDDPCAVRAAVDALIRSHIPKQAVRGYIMHLLTADRHNFLLAANKLVAETFGVRECFKSFAAFETGLTAWRSPDEFVAPLAELSQ